MEFYRKIFKKIDYKLMAYVALIITFSLIILNSATAHLSGNNMQRQLIAIILGVIFGLLVLRLDYAEFARHGKLIYVLNILLLVSVLVFGYEAKGAKAWIRIPVIGSVQPAEFSKLLLIIGYAAFLDKRRGRLSTFAELMPAFLYLVPMLLLIMKQPDLGTGLVFIAIMVGMLFVAGANPWILLTIFGGGIAAALLYVFLHLKFGVPMPLKEYQLNRILVLFDPTIDPRGIGWNVLQAKIAVGNGGLLGQGIGRGTQSMGQFLPEQWTDFIFAVMAEETGFIGTGVLLGLYYLALRRGMRIARDARDLYGTLVATGIVSMYLFHILENIGMNIGLMPVTGIPLPFTSYGGTAMIANLIGISLLLNIHIRKQKLLF